MKQEEKVLISLASSIVNQTSADIHAISAVDMDELYRLAEFHQMTALVAAALESAGVTDARLQQEQAKAIRKNLLLDHDRADIEEALEEAQIWYIPLKGVILKEYYPGIGLRQMSDNDILFDVTPAVS